MLWLHKLKKKTDKVSCSHGTNITGETDIKHILCRGLQLIQRKMRHSKGDREAGIATSIILLYVLSDEVTFEQRLEGSEGVSCLKLFGRRAC